MSRILTLYRSTVGKKIAMAATGVILVGFVIGHMIGNLKIFMGQESFDAYAHFLREMGYPLLPHEGGLWIARIVLLGAVLIHIISATQLTLTSWGARSSPYKKQERLAFSYASYTMRWGGFVVGLYVIFHLLHLTTGNLHPEFGPSPFNNVVVGFQVWWVSAIYLAAMLVLGLHLYHGIWSGLQTLGINNPDNNTWRRPFAAIIAVVVVAGYIAIPLSVLTGVVKPVLDIAEAAH